MAKKTSTVEKKLKALYELQKIDSKIDELKTLRGELPLEVSDLEDDIAGLETRVHNFETEVKELETTIANNKNQIAESEAAIKKYTEQQNNVRNNREYDALSKEIEFQTLEIQLAEKKIKEAKFSIDSKSEPIDQAKANLDGRKNDLEAKKGELDDIIAETQSEEDKLLEDSNTAREKIDERLLFAYDRLRKNAVNGLAVVTVERDACGGCFNKIPPQRQMDIQAKKKVIVCEHCGRILVDDEKKRLAEAKAKAAAAKPRKTRAKKKTA